MYSRPLKDSHLDTVEYEIDMLRFCLRRVSDGTLQRQSPDEYVYLEAFLLHYRNLVRFFSGVKHKGSDISMDKPQVWAGRVVPPEEAQSYMTSAKVLDDDYVYKISKYLHHCTEERFNVVFGAWKVSEMYARIAPLLAKFENAFLDRCSEAVQLGEVLNSTATVRSFRSLNTGIE
jgi:hypothetical protein